MRLGPFRQRGVTSLDTYGQGMLEAVSIAVDHVLSDPTVELTAALRTKLGYFDTDVLRLANVNKRYLQFLLAQRWPTDAPSPEKIWIFAMAMAIRGWLRQVQIHGAYYKHMQTMQGSAYVSTSASRGDGDRALADAMNSHSTTVRAQNARLVGLDLLTFRVVMSLGKIGGGRFTAAQVNQQIKNLAYTIECANAPGASRQTRSVLANQIIDKLVENGIAENVEAVLSKGRPVRQARWLPWSIIAATENSMSMLRHLGLNRDAFADIPADGEAQAEAVPA